MIQINIGDHRGSEFGSAFTAIPTRYRDDFRWARQRAIWITNNIATADPYFRSLPRRRTLTNLLADNTIWINYDGSTTAYGYTYQNKNLWVGLPAMVIGRWTILATIVHELAHIGGAIGGATTCSAFSASCHAAERAVLECGMGKRSEMRTRTDDPATPYDPNIIG